MWEFDPLGKDPVGCIFDRLCDHLFRVKLEIMHRPALLELHINHSSDLSLSSRLLQLLLLLHLICLKIDFSPGEDFQCEWFDFQIKFKLKFNSRLIPSLPRLMEPDGAFPSQVGAQLETGNCIRGREPERESRRERSSQRARESARESQREKPQRATGSQRGAQRFSLALSD